MTSTAAAAQPDLFDMDARENAEGLLRRFLTWYDALPAAVGDRKPVEWFAAEARDFLENPFTQPWSNA